MAEKESVILDVQVDTDKAQKELDDVRKSMEQLTKSFESGEKTQKEYNAEMRRLQKTEQQLTKVTESKAGSYNQLSAVYSRVKAELNAMSAVERKSAKGQELERHASDVYEQMNELQKATGKYTLQVGNYEIASKSLKTELRELTEQLADMKLAGKDNSQEYANLVARAGELRDAMDDANQAIRNTASDTSNLDAILEGASAVTGGFGLATSAMSIFGANTEAVEKAQKKLQEAIALVNSVQAIANSLNRDSALMTKLHAVAQKLLAKTMQQTATATNSATTATKKWKVALATTGIGVFLVALGSAVALFTEYLDKAEKATQKQRAYNKAIADGEKVLNQYDSAKTRYMNLLRASGAEEVEIAKEEERIAKDREKMINEQLAQINELVKAREHEYNVEVMKGETHSEEERQRLRDMQKYRDELAEQALNAENERLVAGYNYQKAVSDKQRQDDEEEAERRKAQAEKEYNDKMERLQAELALTDEYSEENRQKQKEIYDLELSYAIMSGKNKETAEFEHLKKMRDLNESFATHEKELADKELQEELERMREIENFRKTMGDLTLTDRQSEYQRVIDDTQALNDTIDKMLDESKISEAEASAYRIMLEENEKRQLTEIAKKHEKEDEERTKAELQREIDLRKQYIDNAKSVILSLADMQNEDTKEGFRRAKALRIAEATMTTWQGAISAYKSAFDALYPTDPIAKQALAISSAGAVVAQGMANIQKIRNTSFGGGGSSASSSSSSGSAVRTTTSVSDTIIGKTAEKSTYETNTPRSVLVVDEVTAKQMQISKSQKIATA